MARKKQVAENNQTDEIQVDDALSTTTDDEVQVNEVMLETEVLEEPEVEAVLAETTDDSSLQDEPSNSNENPLSMSVTNHGGRYWDMVNKIWIETGYNFLSFDDEIKKHKLINNLVQVNMLAGYDRFEWVV